jgi:hypothetical protein
MKFKHFAMSTAVLLSTMSTASNADSFEPKAVSAGVEYRMIFGGSTRAKPQAPTLGFNVSLIRAQNGPAIDFSPPSFSYTDNRHSKLIDARFDSNSKTLTSMHVNGVDVLYDSVRLNAGADTVDLKVKTANVNYGLALAAALAVVVVDSNAKDDAKRNQANSAPTSCPKPTFSTASAGILTACKFSD